jgi:hypothetical protein
MGEPCPLRHDRAGREVAMSDAAPPPDTISRPGANDDGTGTRMVACSAPVTENMFFAVIHSGPSSAIPMTGTLCAVTADLEDRPNQRPKTVHLTSVAPDVGRT